MQSEPVAIGFASDDVTAFTSCIQMHADWLVIQHCTDEDLQAKTVS